MVKLRVKSLHTFGAFLQFPEGVDGLLPISAIPKGTKLEEGQEVEVKIIELSPEKITLSMRESFRCMGYRTRENIMAQRIGLRKGISISNAKAVKQPVSDIRK